MLHSRLFAANKTYRETNWLTGNLDEKVIVQFCANDAKVFCDAAKLVDGYCDAIELNLGCPQGIARAGHYGAFLMEEPLLISELVRSVNAAVLCPVVVKIRIFPEVERTIEYAKMLVDAGAAWITVHGRLREQKGASSGLADWSHIKAVKDALDVPVFANGNILYFDDIERCLEETGVDGVMIAENALFNPGIFSSQDLLVRDLLMELIEIWKIVPYCTNLVMLRGHLFKLCHYALSLHIHLRASLTRCHTKEEYLAWSEQMCEQLEKDADGWSYPKEWPVDPDGYRVIPHWVAQPYIRPDFRSSKVIDKRVAEEVLERQSKKKERKERGRANEKLKMKKHKRCEACSNVAAPSCSVGKCRNCCPGLECPSHARKQKTQQLEVAA
jgi:tRNA-dihydrouridine synthase 1